MMQINKLSELAKSTIISSVLDILEVNYSVIDPYGNYIAQNKVMKNSISKGLVNAERVDKLSWEHCKVIMEKQKREVKEEKFKKKYFLSIKQPLIENKKTIGILIISFDITKQKQSEIAKEEFIKNMSHDLRTPLAGIISISHLLSKAGENYREQKFGKMIEDSGNQLLELLNAVLNVLNTEHQLDHVKTEVVHLSQLAHELQTLMQPSLEAKHLNFSLKLDKTLPPIITQRIKLKRLLINLLSNAVKFTQQGSISLAINLVAVQDEQAKVVMRISDTGIGIAEEKLDKIFERFYRDHPSYLGEYTGYGLGLYLVQKAIESLGGNITVSSKQGAGSCFSLEFNFPLAKESDQPTPQDAASSTVSPVTSKRSGTVLIAEDNALVAYALKAMLINLGYEVLAVTEGKAALQALQTHVFSWVLLDIGLPDLKGTEIVQRYRQWEQANNKPQLPIFALTAHAEKSIKDRCCKVGFDDVLQKPFTEKNMQRIEKFLK